MLTLFVIVSALSSMLNVSVTLPKRHERCIASVFGTPGDKHMGTRTACVTNGSNVFDPNVVGIASRTLPCGKRVLIRLPRTGKTAVAKVIDRGPYGALLEDGTWVLKTKRADPGVWRGCVDMTPALSRHLNHNGWETVGVWYF